MKKRLHSLRFLWCYYFGGWIEEENCDYGFYGIIPAWFRRQKENISEWCKVIRYRRK